MSHAFFPNLWFAVRQLDGEHLEMGRDWYPMVLDTLNDISRESHLEVDVLAYALACLSPGVSWDQAVTALGTLLDAKREGLADPPTVPSPFGTGHAGKAWRILHRDGAIARMIANGPKVEAFAEAILGDIHAVPVDSHITSIASAGTIRQLADTQVPRVVASIRTIAVLRHEEPRAIQAALWLS